MAAEKKSVLYRYLFCKTDSSSKRLFEAIKNEENESTIETLLQEGVDIDCRDTEGFTPLIFAANCKRRSVVVLLIKYGANIDYCADVGWTLLHFACCFGWTDIVQYLAKRVIDLNPKTLKGGWTPIHFAVSYGHLQVVKCLVEQGVDVNVRCHNGFTPLLYAALGHQTNVFGLLLHAGASVRCFTNSTLLHFVTRQGLLDEVKSLVNFLLLPDLEARNADGETALLLACKIENLDIAEYLFQENASCDVVSKRGDSALSYLVKMERPSVKLVKLFMENIDDLLPADYNAMLNSALLKVDVLQDVDFCCQIIVSKFNNCDLPALYKLSVIGSLPRMHIVSCSRVFREIKQTVQFEVQTKGHCNPFKVQPCVLKVLCVKSVLKYFAKKYRNTEFGPGKQNILKKIFNILTLQCHKFLNQLAVFDSKVGFSWIL